VSALISQGGLFKLIGLIVLLQAWMSWRDRAHTQRWRGTAFWLLFALPFLLGDTLRAGLGDTVAYRLIGATVVLMALLAGSGALGSGSHRQPSATERSASAQRLGSRLFMPALVIPLITLLCVTVLAHWRVGAWPLLDPANPTLAALGLACVIALFAAWALTGGTPLQAVRESRRLFDGVGWALVLPQMLAMLGGVFLAAHTGEAVQRLAVAAIDPHNRLLMVVVYALGMALFTVVMGNAFAAFPVMSAGIAVPFLIVGQHADPAPLLAIGMYCGYCGTLLTPMAANFNIVPAALLELRDRYQVIKLQAPTALAVLALNIVLIYVFAFR
jgi:uncharacterized membrane protein